MSSAANYVCTHQSGAFGVVYAADEKGAIEAYRRVYSQPVGTVTARVETTAEGADRERASNTSRYQSYRSY